MDFQQLVTSIKQTHEHLKIQVSHSINIGLSLRNWLIGYYIAEYELNGADRAAYGERILPELAEQLKTVSNCNKRQLYRYLRFYRFYPHITNNIPVQFNKLLPEQLQEVGTNPPIDTNQKVGTVYPLSSKYNYGVLETLSYSHIEQLVDIDDETKRFFYEVECINGNWSVRELQRQINSLYYERSGLSTDKKKLSKLADQNAEIYKPETIIRNPYFFEFLGLKPKEVMCESHLENQLIAKLEDFLLELGNGFCFESRQKRILIGDELFFIDLVFYHRVLKCHVLVELKVEPFTHENIGQLNTYVSWYKNNMMSAGDNPPIGILLCTEKNHALVEYALAGMDNNLFVSKYLLELPPKEEMQNFIENQVKEFEENI
jgi:predicted nuclease of restriction endonuclease-like (RecB) superfamily